MVPVFFFHLFLVDFDVISITDNLSELLYSQYKDNDFVINLFVVKLLD